MSLPPEFRTSELEEINKKLVAFTPEQFGVLAPLTKDDLMLFGVYIQHYNYIDFNLRRSIEVFRHAKMLPPQRAKGYPKYPDAELPTIAMEVVKEMNPAKEDIETSITYLTQIDLGRPYRNIMGHFAAKRFGDVIVFASKDERDAERTIRKPLNKDGVLIAVAPAAALRGLAVSIGRASDWLAQQFSDWYKRYEKPHPSTS
jgi:hypothetical protein